MAVSTRVTFARSGYWVSIRWSGTARTNINSVAIVCILFFSHKKRGPGGRVQHSVSWLRWFVLGGTMEVQGGALRDSFEHHVTVPDLTAPVVQRERMDTGHVAA